MSRGIAPLELLADVVRLLRQRKVQCGLFGAFAMAAYGVVRFTGDADLLVVDEAVLSPAFWRGFRWATRVTYGDDRDPFAGVVEVTKPNAIRVDILVGRFPWQRRILQRVVWRRLGGLRLPVLQLPDVILTKLFAGGIQDRADLHFLLTALDVSQRRQLVGRLRALPEDARKLYRELVAQMASRPRRSPNRQG